MKQNRHDNIYLYQCRRIVKGTTELIVMWCDVMWYITYYIIALPIPVNFVTSSLYIITDNVLRYWASRPRNEHNNTSLFVLFLHTTRYFFEMYVVTYDCHFHCLKIQRIHETNLCSQQFIEVYMCVYVYVRVSLWLVFSFRAEHGRRCSALCILYVVLRFSVYKFTGIGKTIK